MKQSIYGLALAGALLATITACGSNNGGTSGASSTSGSGSSGTSALSACNVGDGTKGNGASVKIGSKPFAEQQLLATMTKLVLEKNGFKVDYSTQAADPAIDQALRNGSIDMLWQYTGTELQQQLNVDQLPTDLNQAFALAKEKDATVGLCWVAPAPMNDTNGLAIKASDKARFGSTLTDFGNYLKANPTTTVCIMSEFRTRADGLPGLQKVYDSGYTAANYKDIGSTAEAPIASGDCQAGEVFTTDSAIADKNLAVLTDDKALFPPDNVGLIVRAPVLSKNPAIANLMSPVAAKLTSDQITQLNKQVEIDKMSVNDVAKNWLTQNGFLQ
jgi:osmoprotectant transport system substrate-binding protein